MGRRRSPGTFQYLKRWLIRHYTLRNNYRNVTLKGCYEGRFSKTVLGACVDGHFTLLFCLITMEKEVVYILTVRENVIIRYVEVMRILHPFSLRFVGILVHFGYNSCVRAYNIFSHGKLLDNNTFYHFVPNLNSSEAIYSCA